MHIKRHLKNENGASSILVIILLVVLMVFGIAVLTTSLSNIRLSEKKMVWSHEYYQLEGKAEEQIAYIDGLLTEAKEEAKAYVNSGKYKEDYDVKGDDQGTVDKIFRVEYLRNIEKKMDESGEKLEGLYYAIDTIGLEDLLGGEEFFDGRIEFQVSEEKSEYPKYICVSLDVFVPSLQAVDKGENRYAISEFVEWQEYFEYEEGIEFDDPF